MRLDRVSFLSFIIKTTGEALPAMPDDEEFSLQQLHDYVAGPPEVLCETQDGYLLFHNRNGRQQQLPLNPLASSVYAECAPYSAPVTGRAFLAHPDHIPAFWRRTLRSSLNRDRRIT